MDILEINQILSFIESDFYCEKKLDIESGQRFVFDCRKKNESEKKYILKISQNISPDTIARLQREIKILSEHSAKFLPKIHEHSYFSMDNLIAFFDRQNKVIDQNYVPFFYSVEDYIENISWDEFRKYINNELDIIVLLDSLFNALFFLWENKIIHRDIKQNNILLLPDKTFVIIDFGVAKSLNFGTCDITSIGAKAPCTYIYAAPEQYEGNNNNEITCKCDQYSIGVTIYKFLTNQFPFGDPREIGENTYFNNVKNNSHLNFTNSYLTICEQLKKFILKLIEYQPYKRFRTIKDIQEELRKLRSNYENSSSSRS